MPQDFLTDMKVFVDSHHYGRFAEWMEKMKEIGKQFSGRLYLTKGQLWGRDQLETFRKVTSKAAEDFFDIVNNNVIVMPGTTNPEKKKEQKEYIWKNLSFGTFLIEERRVYGANRGIQVYKELKSKY